MAVEASRILLDIINFFLTTFSKVIMDDAGNHLKPYPQIYGIFQELHRRGHKLAVIQVTPAENITRNILHLMELDKFITYQEIYVAPKWAHIERYVTMKTCLHKLL